MNNIFQTFNMWKDILFDIANKLKPLHVKKDIKSCLTILVEV
jgi:hypothetical protein